MGTIKRLIAAGVWALVAGCGEEMPVDPSCFSPNQNIDIAYTSGAVGCACRADVDKEVCLPDRSGRLVALICDARKQRWISVEDGPCWKQ